MKLNKIISDININGKRISNIGKITFFNQLLDGNIVNVNFVSKKFPYVTKNINMKNSYLRNLKSLSYSSDGTNKQYVDNDEGFRGSNYVKTDGTATIVGSVKI